MWDVAHGWERLGDKPLHKEGPLRVSPWGQRGGGRWCGCVCSGTCAAPRRGKPPTHPRGNVQALLMARHCVDPSSIKGVPGFLTACTVRFSRSSPHSSPSPHTLLTQSKSHLLPFVHSQSGTERSPCPSTAFGLCDLVACTSHRLLWQLFPRHLEDGAGCAEPTPAASPSSTLQGGLSGTVRSLLASTWAPLQAPGPGWQRAAGRVAHGDGASCAGKGAFLQD